jgi:hypothetical protein
MLYGYIEVSVLLLFTSVYLPSAHEGCGYIENPDWRQENALASTGELTRHSGTWTCSA